jgi:hypothetical protein
MENTHAYTLMMVALVVGGLFGAYAFPTTEKVVNPLNEALEQQNLQLQNANIAYQTEVAILKANPMVKEVFVETVLEVDRNAKLLDDAYNELLNHMEDEDLLVCNGDEYSLSEVSKARAIEEYSVDLDDEDTTISFSVKLRFDEDSERSCYDTIDAEVYFEEGEDAVVTI